MLVSPLNLLLYMYIEYWTINTYNNNNKCKLYSGAPNSAKFRGLGVGEVYNPASTLKKCPLFSIFTQND